LAIVKENLNAVLIKIANKSDELHRFI